jgi:hypothetical protein
MPSWRPFGATEPGISSVELLLPLAMTLVQDGLLDLPTLLARLSGRPRPCACRRVSAVGRQRTWCCSTRKADRGRRNLAVAGENCPFIGHSLPAACATPWWTDASAAGLIQVGSEHSQCGRGLAPIAVSQPNKPTGPAAYICLSVWLRDSAPAS